MEASDRGDSSDEAFPAHPGLGTHSRRSSLRPVPGGELTVLVLGTDGGLAGELRRALGGAVRQAPTADETEGIGVDVCVIAGPAPVEQLRCLRTHPHLAQVPTVLVAPGPASAPGTVPVGPGPDLATRVATAVRQLGATPRTQRASARSAPSDQRSPAIR